MKIGYTTSKTKKRLWLAWSMLAMTLSLSVACNKNNANNTPPPVGAGGAYGYGAGCMNCNFAQVVMASAQSQGTNTFPVTINWQVIADQNIINQYAAQGMSPQKTYNGPVALQGAMNLSTSITAGNCMIPAGQYQISANQAGTMSYGAMNIPQLVATGPAQIVFTFQQAVVVDSNGDGQIERIAGLLVPVQGPGYGGMYPGTMYPGTAYPGTAYPGTVYPGTAYPGAVGGMVNCGDIGVYLQ